MESSVLVKAFAILEALAGFEAGRSLGDLAEEVGASKPTVHRILKTLTALGYAEHCAGGVYRQTANVRRLVSRAEERHLMRLAEPLLRKLHEQTGETVNLGVLQQGWVRYLQVWESVRPLRRVVTADSLDPFYCTSLGRAIVSRLPKVQQQHLLNTIERKTNTPKTIVERQELERVLDEARQLGYSVEADQTDVGVTCIGAAICNQSIPVAAVSLSIPTARASAIELQPLVNIVCQTATAISTALHSSTPLG